MKKGLLTTSALLVSAGLLAACGNNNQAENSGSEGATDGNQEGKLQVTASFYPMYEFASQVAGDRADVEMILSANQDAHSFEPSPQDVARVDQSDVFVYSSDEMEFWVPSLLESTENDDLVVARAIDGMNEAIEADHADHDHGHEDDHDHGHEDDHDHDHEDDHDHGHEDDHDHDHEDDHDHGHEDDHDHDHEDDHDHGHEDDHNHGHEDDHDHDHGHEDEENETTGYLGLSGHYHSGDTVSLLADVETDQPVTWVVEENGQTSEVELAADEPFEYTLDNGSVQVYYVVDGQQADSVQLHVDDHEELDPHIWLDPVYAQDQVNAIRDAFIEADPEGEETYRQNAADFNQQLADLHDEYTQAFSGAENRSFVVQHEAFGHLANRYNLDQISIGGLSTEVEPSPSRLIEVGPLVEEHGVPVIYYQEGADTSAAQTVAEETGTEIAELYDLEILTDDLADQGMSYIDIMRHNLDQLKLSIQ